MIEDLLLLLRFGMFETRGSRVVVSHAMLKMPRLLMGWLLGLRLLSQ